VVKKKNSFFYTFTQHRFLYLGRVIILSTAEREAQLSSFNFGYYRLPRKADVKTIAGKRKVPRTTFQEHMNKGQNKLIVSLIPYLQLFKQASTKRRDRLEMKVE